MKSTEKPKHRNAQMFPKGYVQKIANAAKCTPRYVSEIIHNPEKFSGPTAELVKKLANSLNEQLNEVKITI